MKARMGNSTREALGSALPLGASTAPLALAGLVGASILALAFFLLYFAIGLLLVVIFSVVYWPLRWLWSLLRSLGLG
jgi:hypothetical protein